MQDPCFTAVKQVLFLFVHIFMPILSHKVICTLKNSHNKQHVWPAFNTSLLGFKPVRSSVGSFPSHQLWLLLLLLHGLSTAVSITIHSSHYTNLAETIIYKYKLHALHCGAEQWLWYWKIEWRSSVKLLTDFLQRNCWLRIVSVTLRIKNNKNGLEKIYCWQWQREAKCWVKPMNFMKRKGKLK